MPSAKTARKVTAATRANATIRVLKRSGVTAGCFCVVVSSAPAAAAVASAIDGSRVIVRVAGGKLLCFANCHLPGVPMSACTFLPKLADFCLLAPPLPLLSARAWRWSTRPRLRFRPSVSSSSPWSPRARLRPPSSRSLRWAQPTTQGHSLRRPRLRLWRRSIRPRRRSRAQDEQVRQRACSEGHEGERARPCGRATPRRF